MASLIPNILPKDPYTQIYLVGASLVLLIGIIFAATLPSSKVDDEDLGTFKAFLRFFYASFLKPHTGDGTGNGQQDALESFYKAQAGVYDATRKRLLRGREDMLGLVAAQLVQKETKQQAPHPKRIWVDVSIPQSTKPTQLIDSCRLGEELDGISKRCPNLSLSRNSSRVSTSLTSPPLSAKWLGNDLLDLGGQM